MSAREEEEDGPDEFGEVGGEGVTASNRCLPLGNACLEVIWC
jgi:hypothetical protein